MSDSGVHDVPRAATADGLTVSPALDVVREAALDVVREAAQVPRHGATIDRRVVQLCVVTTLLGVAAALVALLLISLIGFITNLAYYGRLSLEPSSPAAAVPRLGLWSIPIPVLGALIVGVIARFGSKAIRGHGIPEAMEQIPTNSSRIPVRVTFPWHNPGHRRSDTSTCFPYLLPRR
ncbi:MAG: hypothetical protein ABIZ91_06325 [Gemmatimonadaceae bacterium]